MPNLVKMSKKQRFKREQIKCSYGENAWQKPASFCQSKTGNDPLALNKFRLISGSLPSYNNLCDLDRLLQTITHVAAAFDLNRSRVPFIAVAAKHGNPCGAATGQNPAKVLKKTISGDTRAIFGGIIITNFRISQLCAKTVLFYLMPKGQRRLLDGIIAPSFALNAVKLLQRKGGKCRLLANSALNNLTQKSLDRNTRFRFVRGGYLRQPNYTFILNLNDKSLEKSKKAPKTRENDLLLAWAVGSTSNSNAITLTRNNQLIGNGVGQQDRIGGCALAVKKARDAGHKISGATAYSDSFFPFTDAPAELTRAGVKTILSSSGSVRDNEVKRFCEKNNITLYLIPDKIGRGFFGH